MIGTSLPEYIFIRTVIALLRLVTPASFALTAAYLVHLLSERKWLVWLVKVPHWAMLYPLAECLFFLAVFLPWTKQLKQAAEHPPLRPRHERERLFRDCQENIPDAESYTRVWFHGSHPSELLRENIEDWLLWAVFSADRHELDDHPEWRDELAGYVSDVERKVALKFPDGRNHEARSIRLTLDDVEIIHRPLIWYMIVANVDLLAFSALQLLGFSHYASPHWFSVFPFRPYTTFCRRSSSEVSYWYRPHRNPDKHPILFVHGLGIGLWAYIRFFYMVVRAEPDVGIIAVELMPVSMRITAPIPRREKLVTILLGILARHRFTSVMLASHSYGSIVATHMLRKVMSVAAANEEDASSADAAIGRPANGHSPGNSPLIHAMLLIDPVAILLHLPTTASNFVYRRPRAANEWQLWFFASRDAGISHTLSRRFFWADNLLWKTDLGKDKLPGGAAVVLSECDQITPSPDIWTYLTGRSTEADPIEAKNGVLRWQSGQANLKDNDLEVLFERGFDHAQVFDESRRLQQVVKITQRLIRPRQPHSLYHDDIE